MNLACGAIVRSICGKDKDKFLVVLGIDEEGNAMVSDGDKRPVENPKRKNPKHLRLTGTVIGQDDLTNKKIRSLLRDFLGSKP